MIIHSILDLINNHFHVHIVLSNFISILESFLHSACSITMFLLSFIFCNLVLVLALSFILLSRIHALFAVLILVSRHPAGICGFILNIFIWRRILSVLGKLLVGYYDLIIHATFLPFFFWLALNPQDSCLNTSIL